MTSTFLDPPGGRASDCKWGCGGRSPPPHSSCLPKTIANFGQAAVPHMQASILKTGVTSILVAPVATRRCHKVDWHAQGMLHRLSWNPDFWNLGVFAASPSKVYCLLPVGSIWKAFDIWKSTLLKNVLLSESNYLPMCRRLLPHSPICSNMSVCFA